MNASLPPAAGLIGAGSNDHERRDDHGNGHGGEQRVARDALHERDRLFQLFDQAPGFLAMTRGPEHRYEFVNAAAQRFFGGRALVGHTVAEALPEAVEQGFLALLDQVYATGQPHEDTGARFMVRTGPDGALAEAFLDFVYKPLRDPDGRVTGIITQAIDVTERTRVDAALRESEARFRSALQAGRMGSWETNFETGTRMWSQEAMTLFGLSLPDGRGTVGGDDDEYVRAMHPDDRHCVEVLHRRADEHDHFNAEYRVQRPDGSVLWLSGRGMVIERMADGRAKRLISIMADATERKQAELALRVERERLSLALGAGRMGAYDMNIAEGTLWWSPQMYELFGVHPDNFSPTPERITALIHPDDRAEFLVRRTQAIAERRPFSHEARIVRPDGTEVWVGHRGQAEYDNSGRPIRSFGITMDISERKRVEALLRDEDRKKDNFIATLAHELRNPLAPIRNAVSLLRQLPPAGTGVASPAASSAGSLSGSPSGSPFGSPATASRSAWCLDVIDRQAGQMAHLLDDLLDVSRLSRGQLQLRREPLQLAMVIEQALEIAQPSLDAGEHDFSMRLPPAPVWLDGDLTRLAQVFSNVLINAAKYTPAQGRIRLEATVGQGSVDVLVQDNGIGIAPENVERIFEMFGQVESALNRAQGGQGIGLALARGLLGLHHGSIAASSAGPGRGSEFRIRLPLAEPPTRQDQAQMHGQGNGQGHGPGTGLGHGLAHGQQDGQQGGQAHGRADGRADGPTTGAGGPRGSRAVGPFRILIADDLRDIADSLARLLESQGHTVAVAYDGVQAVELAAALQPDVAVLDLGMPRLNGYEVCSRIRATEWGRRMMLVAQTGWGQEKDRQRAHAAGFDHHVIKPIATEVLLSLLATGRR